jgi:hypothetical protein
MSDKCDWAMGAKREDDWYGEVTRCVFCGKEAVRQQCVDEDWTPSFWDTATETEYGHACPDCSLEHLDVDEDGPLLKPGHVLPAGCVPLGDPVPPDRRYLKPPCDN